MSAPADIIEAIRTLVFHLPEGAQVQAIRTRGEKRATVLYTKREEHWIGIIAALHVEQEKRGMLASVDALLEKLGEDHAYVDAKLPEHARGKWQRNRRYLRFVINLLQSDVKS